MKVVINGYSGSSCYRNWANVVIKGYSVRGRYKELAKAVIKGYNGSSYYSILKNVLVKHHNFRCNMSHIISFYKNNILCSRFCTLLFFYTKIFTAT